MQLEFHQLDRRWEHLRVRHPARQRRLLASLAEVGQQTPIVVVVAAEGQTDRYLVIDATASVDEISQRIKDGVREVLPDPVPRTAEAITGSFPVIPDHPGDARAPGEYLERR